jgi:hypothetical protein
LDTLGRVSVRIWRIITKLDRISKGAWLEAVLTWAHRRRSISFAGAALAARLNERSDLPLPAIVVL